MVTCWNAESFVCKSFNVNCSLMYLQSMNGRIRKIYCCWLSKEFSLKLLEVWWLQQTPEEEYINWNIVMIITNKMRIWVRAHQWIVISLHLRNSNKILAMLSGSCVIEFIMDFLFRNFKSENQEWIIEKRKLEGTVYSPN